MNKIDILKKLSAFSIGPIVGAVVSFITIPVITFFISPEEFGKASMFAVALSVIQLVVFLGMDQAYAKRYYESNNKSSLFVNAVIPSLILVIICEIISLFMFKNLSIWIFDSPTEYLCVFAFMAIIPALTMERFFLLNIRMSQRGKLYSEMSILSKVLILVGTVLFFFTFEKSFRSVVIGNTIAQIIFAIILYWIQRKEIIIHFKWVRWEEIRGLLKFGLFLVPTSIIGWVLTGMDKVMLRSLSTYEQLGLYSVATKVAAVLTLVQACFTTFWVPLAYQWNSENVDKRKFVKVGNFLSCVMSLLFAFTLLAKNAIFLFFSKDYSTAANIVPFLLFTPIMYTVSEVTVMGIYFKEKTGWTVLVSTLSAIVNLGLNIILIPVLGPIGAAIATGLSYITFFWTRTMLSRRIWFKFPLKNYILITVVLLIDSVASTFLNGLLMYGMNVMCICILIVYFYEEEKELYSTVSGIIKSVFKKKNKHTSIMKG